METKTCELCKGTIVRRKKEHQTRWVTRKYCKGCHLEVQKRRWSGGFTSCKTK